MKKQFLICLIAGVVLFGQTAFAQPTGLVVGYDFEDGAPGDITADVSSLAPAAPLPLKVGASVVADADLDRGMVLAANLDGEHAEITPHPAKMDKHPTWTFQAWFKEADNALNPQIPAHGWQSLGGIDGRGIRMFYIHGREGEIEANPLTEGASVLGAVWLCNQTDLWAPVAMGIPDVEAFDPNAWHHLLMTFDGDKLYLYLDGQTNPEGGVVDRLGTQTCAGDLENDELVVGGYNTGSIFPFPGKLDDVAMWSGYAPPESVQGLFDGTYNLTDSPPPLVRGPIFGVACEAGAVPEDDLVAWWHFEEGPGATTTADIAPNPAPDGTLEKLAAIEFVNAPLMPPSLFDVDTAADTSQWLVGNVLSTPDADPNNAETTGGYVAVATTEGDKLESSELDFGFTLMAWIKPSNLMNDETFRWFVSKGQFGPRLRYVDGGIGFDVDFVDAVSEENFSFVDLGREEDHGAIVELNQWHHVAGVWIPDHPPNDFLPNVIFDPNDPGTWGFGFNSKIELYIDGHLRGSNAGAKGPIVDTGTDPVFINNPGVSFDGMIDDVRLYKMSMTQEQIRCAMMRQCETSTASDLAGGDCNVNYVDFSILGSEWQSTYTLTDLTDMANDWLTQGLFFPSY